MKTINNIPALSFALIFCASIFASNGTSANNGGSTSLTSVITYQVTVNVVLDQKLSNAYQVQIMDKFGNLVAPPQPFIAGITKYTFFERGSAEGIRIARLVQLPSGGQVVGENQMVTTPVILYGLFKGGEIYHFDLYPSIQSTLGN